MTTSTLFSSVGYNQNAGGPPVPAQTVVNTSGMIERANFTLTVSPVTGWAEAVINWGPDNINFPGQMSIFENPTGTGTVVQDQRFRSAGLSAASGGNDGAQYFKAELVTISPGATATLTMTY